MAEFIFHRGSHQIGGICAEIRTATSRVIIDFGANLPNTDDETSMSDDELYNSVFEGKEKPDAILFTHYHGDHIGLVERIPKDIPLYIGPTAKKICLNLHYRTDYVNKTNVSSIIKEIETYKAGEQIYFGDIKITPYQIGHSALDSYMFLIEADGKRILYTGDFRDHGIVCSRKTFEKLITTCVKKIDVLITEGTMFSRSENEIMNEYELCKRAREIFKNHKYNFVLVSSTNLDSIMSFYAATPKGKPFICDNYQLVQINTACNDFGSQNKIGYFRYNFRGGIYTIDKGKFMMDMEMCKKHGFVMLVRAKDKFKPYLEMFKEKESCMIYSMWNGYLKGGKKEDSNIIDFLDGWRIEKLHTSGHASVDCIKRLIELTQPEKIIPMHSERSDEMVKIEQFSEFKDRIKSIDDGNVITI